ncbi:unnamed protein product [Ambrosiozyma monospora]|uniref:Unnamed protein product n=1 Tax=Ambrosiozyma monospora TaxID=43982 RepID=A0A9W7DJK5_AMBMO|nr:unnamed protein product [Ambrosiozyma monospora]
MTRSRDENINEMSSQPIQQEIQLPNYYPLSQNSRHALRAVNVSGKSVEIGGILNDAATPLEQSVYDYINGKITYEHFKLLNGKITLQEFEDFKKQLYNNDPVIERCRQLSKTVHEAKLKQHYFSRAYAKFLGEIEGRRETGLNIDNWEEYTDREANELPQQASDLLHDEIHRAMQTMEVEGRKSADDFESKVFVWW